MKTKIRNASLDRAKGIGILLVILGHLLVYKEHLSNIVYYFHMPLFFVISGCFLTYNPQISLKDQVVKVCYQLLFPYMFFHLIMAVLLGAVRGVDMNWGGYFMMFSIAGVVVHYFSHHYGFYQSLQYQEPWCCLFNT